MNVFWRVLHIYTIDSRSKKLFKTRQNTVCYIVFLKCSRNINENFIYKLKATYLKIHSGSNNNKKSTGTYMKKNNIIEKRWKKKRMKRKESRLKELLSGLFIFIQTKVIRSFFLQFFFETCIFFCPVWYDLRLTLTRRCMFFFFFLKDENQIMKEKY